MRYLLLAFASVCLPVWCAGPLNIPISEYKLKNGMRVVLSEDHSAPTYAIAVTYNVGSRDEKPGRTGFAHLFEHMMFQGSDNVGKGEHFYLIETNGGNENGTTSDDRTNYFETLPSNQLDLGLFLEADRMRSLAVNQPNLDNQRNAVQEERRLRYDNAPYGRTFEKISETAYDSFAYKHSTIGSMEDLNAATLEDVQAFFKRYYAPNNAVLTLVGDFKSAEALAKIKKYFENIPSQPAPPAPDVSEPEQKSERRATIEDNFAQLPRIDVVYKIPAGDTPDFYAVDVLGDILAGGQSSRLYQRLVKEKQLAVQFFGGSYEHRGPSLELFIALARPGADLKAIEDIISEEIQKIQNEPVTDAELEKIRMQNMRQDVQRLQTTQSRAMRIGEYAVYYDDPHLINTHVQKIQQVTKADIQRVAKKYLVDSNKTVVVTNPKKAADAPGQHPAGAGSARPGE